MSSLTRMTSLPLLQAFQAGIEGAVESWDKFCSGRVSGEQSKWPQRGFSFWSPVKTTTTNLLPMHFPPSLTQVQYSLCQQGILCIIHRANYLDTIINIPLIFTARWPAVLLCSGISLLSLVCTRGCSLQPKRGCRITAVPTPTGWYIATAY